jgi:hypothetical protein
MRSAIVSQPSELAIVLRWLSSRFQRLASLDQIRSTARDASRRRRTSCQASR